MADYTSESPDEVILGQAARTALAELQDLSATGELDVDKARLFGRAIIALHPKAALAEATA